MKIEKYVKDKQNKYKVLIDGEAITLYDDVIVKYNLLLKNEISHDEFKEITNYNNELVSYYESIKYINKKLRSKKEIYEYLYKKEIPKDIINKTIKRLEDNNFINEEVYLKAYITDQINLSNKGPLRIEKELIKLGLDENKIKEKLDTIPYEVWTEKIEKYTEKKIKCNHSSSANMLKMKIINELVNQGFNKEDITSIVSKYDIIDTKVLKHEYEKAKKTLSKKYEGYDLEMKIKEKLFRKGFKFNSIKELEDEE